MGRQDCMQSRQDYIIAVKEEKRYETREDSPGDAAKHAESCAVRWQGGLGWRHVGNACGVLRSSEESRFGLVARQEVR